MSRGPRDLAQRAYHPSSCRQLIPYRPLNILPFVCRLLVRVDHLSSRRLLVDVNYSLYQHLLEIQCAVQNIFYEQVMDRGYLGDVGRRTVMRFGTVDPKRPAVAIWPCIHEV
jgi:hypothetical protein